MLLRAAPASQWRDCLTHLPALTDFFFVTCDGTLTPWRDFLKNTTLLPAAFKDIRIDIDYGQRLSWY